MRYDWTPASEPPDTDRDVQVRCDGDEGYVVPYSAARGWPFDGITHWRDWRDVFPPDVEAPK